MSDDTKQEGETSRRLGAAFLAGASRHEDLLLDTDGETWLTRRREYGEYHFVDGFLAHAAGLIAEQTILRLSSDLEGFLNALPDPIRGDDHGLCLMLALFLSGRGIAEGATVKTGAFSFGDSAPGLEHLTIEPCVRLGDFDVDFLLTYSQEGANPAHYDNPSEPVGITISARVALLCDTPQLGQYGDQILRRRALAASMGVSIVSYTNDDIERDPFALATRVVRDLAQRTGDRLYG